MTVISPRSTGLLRAANVATYVRLFLLALVWLLAHNGLMASAGAVAAACLALGLLTGFISRRDGRRETSEARLTAAPDVVMLISAPVWLYWLDPKAVSEHAGHFALFCSYPISACVLVLIRRRRNISGYSYLGKLGTFVVWVFMIYIFETGLSWPIMIGAVILSHIYLAEDLMLLALNDDLDDESKQIMFGRVVLSRLFQKKSDGRELES
ncbi:hypothetical protein [Bradyrhizobium sp. 21]|uniref:hypothetical protein n=1 Tax=Bradyrhizobium sp. 21 TaxID=2782666 RepID=UPI001FF74A51|nr:hypothetical protein [Bradyrhizobium sp. 21]MCK1384096.1 hypothetical protein [Bradyrhizobium sp. 21]